MVAKEIGLPAETMKMLASRRCAEKRAPPKLLRTSCFSSPVETMENLDLPSGRSFAKRESYAILLQLRRHREECSMGRLMKLESIRGFAAAYVVAHHSAIAYGGKPPLLLGFGQEAVILFFLLSGFVIHH